MRLSAGLLTLSVFVAASPAAPAADNPRPAIGVVLSTGQFQVAHVAGSGQATVLAGDQVSSTTLTSRILLKNGIELALAPHSTGSFYQDHANLEDGEFRLKTSSAFYITSRNFTVTPTTPGTQATLVTNGAKLTVQIASGTANVTSSNGEILAHMTTAASLAFDSLSGGSAGGSVAAERNASNANIRLLGVLTKENGHYLLRDRYTNSVFEIAGHDDRALDKNADKLVNRLVSVDGTWMGNQKSPLPQVDHYMVATRIAPSDATTALPCAADGAGGVLKKIVLDGLVSKVRNHFLLKDEKKGTYEVVGDVGDKEVGTDLHETGFILPQRATILPAEKVVYLERRKLIVMASPCVGALIGSTLITTGAVLPAALNSSSTNSSQIAHQISF